MLASSHKIFEEVSESFQNPFFNKNVNLLVFGNMAERLFRITNMARITVLCQGLNLLDESMLMLIRLRIIFSKFAESPSDWRISNSSVKLRPKCITPQTRPFLPASMASDTFSYGTCNREGRKRMLFRILIYVIKKSSEQNC